MISVYQVARQWLLSPRTVAKWVREGKLKPAEGTDAFSWKFTVLELNRFHSQHGLSPHRLPIFECPSDILPKKAEE